MLVFGSVLGSGCCVGDALGVGDGVGLGLALGVGVGVRVQPVATPMRFGGHVGSGLVGEALGDVEGVGDCEAEEVGDGEGERDADGDGDGDDDTFGVGLGLLQWSSLTPPSPGPCSSHS